MMNQDDYLRLWQPAGENAERHDLIFPWGKPLTMTKGRPGDVCWHLAHFLGSDEIDKYYDRPSNQDRPMPEGPLKELLKGMAGPHIMTIYKAWLIRREHDENRALLQETSQSDDGTASKLRRDTD